MISWIMAARNDGYGGELEGVENFAMARLQATVESIVALDVKSEIIIVEWNPPADRPSMRTFLEGQPVSIVTVDAGLQAELDADHAGKPFPFYEYVAKEIGIRLAGSDTLIVCNPDNIFPAAGFDQVLTDIADGRVVRAIRHEIPRGYVLDPSLIATVMRDFTAAAGDFCGFSRYAYQDIGGWAMVHQNLHVDNDFVSRAEEMGYTVVQDYRHFHIHHDHAGTEAPGRPRDWEKREPISEPLLLNLLDHTTRIDL